MSGAEQWHDMFVMSGGAAAALAGLIFVAVSVNVEQITRNRALPLLAARTLAVLIALVVMCILALAPDPSTRRLGAELLAVGVLLAVAVIVATVRGLTGTTLSQRLDDYVTGAVATLPLIVGGVWMLAGLGGGLYWVMGELIGGLVATTYNAWILLIEIRRWHL